MKRFPVLLTPNEQKLFPDCPRYIDWEIIVRFSRQAEANHQQTLEELASRGGLSPQEIMAVVEGRNARTINDVPMCYAIEWLRRHYMRQTELSHIIKYFTYGHLPSQLAEVSKPFCELAYSIADRFPDSYETIVALRKLLEAKDAAVRAAL